VHDAAPLEALHELCNAHQARVICIGDVHGCVEEVCDLLREAKYLPGDQVVFLGEFIICVPFHSTVLEIIRSVQMCLKAPPGTCAAQEVCDSCKHHNVQLLMSRQFWLDFRRSGGEGT
jgi:hypothetical protein